MTATERALLVLEDGRVFTGTTYGAIGQTLGEAVFSTGMSGYQETLTDPSYHGQIVIATAASRPITTRKTKPPPMPAEAWSSGQDATHCPLTLVHVGASPLWSTNHERVEVGNSGQS